MREIKHGQIVPLGLSRRVGGQCKSQLLLRFSFFLWKRKGYDPSVDEYFDGVWTLSALWSIDRYYTFGIGFRFLFGWERSHNRNYVITPA